MKKRESKDVLEIISHFQKTLMNKPTPEQMFEEIRMMKFKIRPTQGDISGIDLHDSRFIETIWSLGKIDELFQKEYQKMPLKKKGIFFAIFDNMYQKFQNDLNSLYLNNDKDPKKNVFVEMEIFKERLIGKKVN
jgi:hypothetical protein